MSGNDWWPRTREGDEAAVAAWRILTVRQPWTSAIVPGGKTIENRAHSAARWRWRGWLGVHAGAGWSARGARDPRVRRHYGMPGLGRGVRRHALDLPERVALAIFPTRCITAIAVVDDIHIARGCHRPWGEDTYTHANGTVVTDVAHLHLVHVVELPEPIEYNHGGLGLRMPTPDLAHELTLFAASIEWDGLGWSMS